LSISSEIMSNFSLLAPPKAYGCQSISTYGLALVVVFIAELFFEIMKILEKTVSYIHFFMFMCLFLCVSNNEIPLDPTYYFKDLRHHTTADVILVGTRTGSPCKRVRSICINFVGITTTNFLKKFKAYLKGVSSLFP
jgi:hypothetical protein